MMKQKAATQNKLEFKPGKVLEEFDTVDKTGKKVHVVFRYPRMSDVNGIIHYMNELIHETEFLRINKKITKKEERKWLEDNIKGMRMGNKIYILAVINGKIAGGSNIHTGKGADSHVGQFGVTLREKYTNIGIGSRLSELIINEAIKIGVEIVRLSHYWDNERAKHVYEKLGFKHVGIIPKAKKTKNGSYQDEALMYKKLV
jgi:RimJ/RimL family protein N-acetyltransferase